MSLRTQGYKIVDVDGQVYGSGLTEEAAVSMAMPEINAVLGKPLSEEEVLELLRDSAMTDCFMVDSLHNPEWFWN